MSDATQQPSNPLLERALGRVAIYRKDPDTLLPYARSMIALADEIERLRRSEALLLEIQKSMADCIGTKEGQTFEDRAEELIVTEVQHMHCSAHEPPAGLSAERVSELLSQCIFHAETGNDQSAAFYGDLATALRAAQPPVPALLYRAARAFVDAFDADAISDLISAHGYQAEWSALCDALKVEQSPGHDDEPRFFTDGTGTIDFGPASPETKEVPPAEPPVKKGGPDFAARFRK